MFRFTTGKVKGRHQILVIYLGYADRLAGELAEIRAAQLRFTEDEARGLLAAAGIALPDPVVAMLHQRTEVWAAGLRLAALSLDGRPWSRRCTLPNRTG